MDISYSFGNVLTKKLAFTSVIL